MNDNLNIFEKLAVDEDYDNFSDALPFSKEQPGQDNSMEINSFEQSEPEENLDIFESLSMQEKEKPEQAFGFLDTLKDIGRQVVSKGISGIAGAYGNLLDTFGLQAKTQLPAERAKNSRDFATLSKMERGEVPSFGEILELSDEDLAPRYSRLPTSKDIQGGIEQLTGVGEGKTPLGRIAGRGAEFAGESLLVPGSSSKVALGLAGSGIAGQSTREAGFPEPVSSAVEVIGALAPSVVQGKVMPKSSPAKAIAEGGRKIGLSESQITPLIQSEKKVAALSKVARKGTKTKELFSSIKESLGDSYQKIKSTVSTLPKVDNKNRVNLIDKFTDIRNELSKTLKPSPDKEGAISFIDEAISKLQNNGAHPEELINFWQDINKSVKWNSIQGGKKSLTKLKEPILEVLNNVAPAAAKDFEITNQLYSKYAQISKKLKPDIIDSFVNKGEIVAGVPAALALIHGNPSPFAGLASEVGLRLLSREMLINPYFQNIANKLVKNFNQGSVKAVKSIVDQAKEYMQRKHPEEDWSFLVEN